MQPIDIVDSGIPMPALINADYLGGHKLHLVFDDGTEGDIDFAPFTKTWLDYQELADPEKFIQFGITGGTITWSDELDVAPDWLYEQVKHSIPS